MFLERRIKGPCLASHAAYSDEDYFRSVTGLPYTKWIHCKRTETTVRRLSFPRRQLIEYSITTPAGSFTDG